METFQVHILAADRTFYEGPCVSLTIPVSDGERGILAHHSPMMAAVVPGMIRWQPPGQEVQLAAVSPGMVKVESNEVLVLVDSAERPEEIDAVRAQREADEAREALLQKKSRQEHQIAQATLARALSALPPQPSSFIYCSRSFLQSAFDFSLPRQMPDGKISPSLSVMSGLISSSAPAIPVSLPMRPPCCK